MRAVLLVGLMSLTGLCIAGPVKTVTVVSAYCDAIVGWNVTYDCTTVVDDHGKLEAYRGSHDLRKFVGREVFVADDGGKIRLVLKPLSEEK